MLDFYSYVLIDPRDGSIFYVGKGSGNRVSAHTKLVRSGRADDNKLKCQRIRDILNVGLEPFEFIVRGGLDEQAAVDVEYSLIMGLNGLTNIISKGWVRSPDELARLAARKVARLESRELAKAWRKIHPKVKEQIKDGSRFRVFLNNAWADLTDAALACFRVTEGRLLVAGYSKEWIDGRKNS